MTEDLGEKDIVGDVLGFEAVATDGAVVGASQVAGFPGRSREPKAAETYLGSCGPVVVLTAIPEKSDLCPSRPPRSFRGSS
jgi:hypothetical protein